MSSARRSTARSRTSPNTCSCLPKLASSAAANTATTSTTGSSTKASCASARKSAAAFRPSSPNSAGCCRRATTEPRAPSPRFARLTMAGVLLGLIGGGGSILAVPVLVYVLGQPIHAATTESLLVVGAAALVGAADHARIGNVRIRTALAFGLAGGAGAIGGSALNRVVGGHIILLAFAALLLLAAWAMQRRRGLTAEPNRRPQAQLRA